jgi:hypothetical protein
MPIEANICKDLRFTAGSPNKFMGAINNNGFVCMRVHINVE